MTEDGNASSIRAASEGDWEHLKRIRLSALLNSPTAFGLSHAEATAYSEQQWRERASGATRTQFLLAFDKGQPVGLIGDVISPAQEYHLIAMYIQPPYRGQRIAARLIEAVKARAIDRGHARVVLSVSPSNVSAVELYRRQGFAFLPEWESLASYPDIRVQRMEWWASESLVEGRTIADALTKSRK